MANKGYRTSRNGKTTDDEHYTRYEDVERLLSRFDLSDKIVYCPCDSEESNFVKYLKGKCKELIYTSDDFHNHKYLVDSADVIITNPPFKCYMEFLRFVLHKPCILICPTLSVASMYKWINFDDLLLLDRFRRFLRPDGGYSDISCIGIYYKGGVKNELSSKNIIKL